MTNMHGHQVVDIDGSGDTKSSEGSAMSKRASVQDS